MESDKWIKLLLGRVRDERNEVVIGNVRTNDKVAVDEDVEVDGPRTPSRPPSETGSDRILPLWRECGFEFQFKLNIKSRLILPLLSRYVTEINSKAFELKRTRIENFFDQEGLEICPVFESVFKLKKFEGKVE